jgi:hypothetical protein
VVGVLTYNALTGTDDIDWSKYALDIPTINVPTLNTPKLAVTKLDVPILTTTSISSNDPILATPSISSNDSTPVLGETSISDSTLNVEQINSNMQISGTKVPALSLPSQDLHLYKEFLEEIQSLFTDSRNIRYDQSIYNPNNNLVLKEWIPIYKQYQDMEPIKFIPVQNKFKMISEVSPIYTQKDIEILNTNLEFYKSNGYDSVLVVFSKNDTHDAVLNTIKYIIKYHGLNVWLAFGGSESLKELPFMEVDTYTKILASSAQYITGYINSWRRTSVHLWKQEAAFMNYTNRILRGSNPNIPILGEIYYGETAKYIKNKFPYGWDTNTFTNASALVICNIGYTRINFKYLFNKLLPRITGEKNYPYVGIVLGTRPYYRSLEKINYTKALEIKHQIETKFFEYNCLGTITLSSDGSPDSTNDLTKTLYNTL